MSDTRTKISPRPKESRVRWGPAVLRDVAMATNFGTQFATIGFVNSDSPHGLPLHTGMS